MADIQSTAAEIRRGKKRKKEERKKERKKLQGKNIMAPLLHRAAITTKKAQAWWPLRTSGLEIERVYSERKR